MFSFPTFSMSKAMELSTKLNFQGWDFLARCLISHTMIDQSGDTLLKRTFLFYNGKINNKYPENFCR